ncbi:MAG: DUF4810 domain-containing protein [Bacteroidales bacterium]|jgi:hypothetical protein|nr:DUF4810 domain-containing protein [Bacteroidales bacterium]
MKKLILLLVIAIMFGGCGKAMYEYHNYNESSYTYTKGGWDEKETKKLIKQFKAIADLPKGSKIMPPPGACADYAFVLLRSGDTIKSKEFFDKEVLIYPESKVFIDKLKEELGL